MVPRYPPLTNLDFSPGSSLTHRLPGVDSRDAVLYVMVVGVLYAAIIIVLVGTNIHRFRKSSARKCNNPPEETDKPLKKAKQKTKEEMLEDGSGIVPLLHPPDHMKEDECVEAIEVSYNANEKKQKFTRSYIKESECRAFKPIGTSTFTSTVKRSKELGDMVDKVSTTVVTETDSDTPSYRKQEIRVGMTEEEDIKPRALLEMIGDDAVEPVAV